LSLTIPSTIAGSLELETCLIVTWNGVAPGTGQCPDGGLIWSDGWSAGPDDAQVVLEGSEFRLPVHTLSFRERFGEALEAVWTVDLDPDIELSDLLANVATVYLNQDVLARDFRSPSGEPDAGALPGVARAGINVDVLRLLTIGLSETLRAHVPNSSYPEGTVGRILTVNLDSAFGSVASALQCCEEDPARFSRLLWSHCAPEHWRVRK
jgi:hypothetical protein